MLDHRLEMRDPDPEAAQAKVVAFLADPRTHGAPVEQIDTHISHVFVSPHRAWKLKRAIRTNFLDYSTPARRHAACLREVEVNRLTAPDLYLGCLPVMRDARGTLSLGGDGEPVDWLVEMQAFDRAQEFDRLLERGTLTDAHILGLADAVAGFHARTPRADRYGGAAAVDATIRQVAGAIATATTERSIAVAAETWGRAARKECAARAARLDTRRRHGRVRRCHGDLHLGNIVLLDDRPTPFDAIEFNEAIASVDVLYDLAFTAMDLLHRGERRMANTLVNRYLAWTRDISGLALMPLFLSMRAAVRVIAAASLANGSGTSAARSLIRFATHVLDGPRKPVLVAIGGLSGSGKSTVSRRLAPDLGDPLGALVIRSDVMRKLLAGLRPEEPLPATAYTLEATRQVYARLCRAAAVGLGAGVPVILDATWLDSAERMAVETVARRAGVPFAGLWLDADPALAERRLDRRGPDASDATPDVLKQQAHTPAPADWLRIDANRAVPDIVAEACRIIRRKIGA